MSVMTAKESHEISAMYIANYNSEVEFQPGKFVSQSLVAKDALNAHMFQRHLKNTKH